jgi:hypothetical protein
VRAGVRIEQQLVGIEAMARVGFVRAMNAVAIELTRPDIRHVAVKDLVGVFRQLDPRRLVAGQMIEEANFDLCRVG